MSLKVKIIGIGFLILIITLVLNPIYNSVSAQYELKGDAMVRWWELKHENLVDVGKGLILTGGYVIATHSAIAAVGAAGVTVVACGIAIAAGTPAIIVGSEHYYDQMKGLLGQGSRGDDIINVGQHFQDPNGNQCKISDVNIQHLDNNYNVIATGTDPKQEKTILGITVASLGTRLIHSNIDTSDPTVKIHWWYDPGVAVRYSPIYTVDHPGCSITSDPPPHFLDTSVQSLDIMASTPTSVLVNSFDHFTGNTVSGKLLINNVEVGNTNTPFTYTFNSTMPGTVITPTYPNTTVNFYIPKPLSVSANPTSIALYNPINVTISAIDPVTHIPVAGKVVIREGPDRIRSDLRDTNTEFTKIFKPIVMLRFPGGFIASAPEVIVYAPPYDPARLAIDFTNVHQ